MAKVYWAWWTASQLARLKLAMMASLTWNKRYCARIYENAGVDVIGVYDNVIIGIGDVEVICLGGDVVAYGAQLAVEF